MKGNALALVVALLPLVAPPALAATPTAVVVQTRPPVRGAIAPQTVWADAVNDTHVAAGDTLKTGPDGAADVLLPTGSHLVLGQNTIVRFVEQQGLGARVLTGRVHILAAPHGVTNVQAGDLKLSGTDAEAVVEKSGGSWQVAVLAGSFQVIGPNDKAVQVPAGKLVAFLGGQPEMGNLRRSTAQDLTLGFSFDTGPSRPAGSEPGSYGEAANTPAAAGNRWVATGLSALLPGTGQLYSGELPRGLIYLGLDFALLGAGFYAKASNQNTLATVAAGGLLALNVISPLDAYFFTKQSKASASAATTAER